MLFTMGCSRGESPVATCACVRAHQREMSALLRDAKAAIAHGAIEMVVRVASGDVESCANAVNEVRCVPRVGRLLA